MFRITIVLVILLIAAAAFIGFLLGKPKSDGSSGITTPKQEINIHHAVMEILPTAEFISLHYRYTSVIKDASSIEIFGFSIPGTEKRMLAMIDGAIKLGIHCKNIDIDTTRTDTLFMKFPPIKIISHELYPESVEVYDEKNGIFNKYRAKDHFALEAKLKSETELDVRANRDIIFQAKDATEYAFRSFLKKLPALDTVPVIFRWN